MKPSKHVDQIIFLLNKLRTAYTEVSMRTSHMQGFQEFSMSLRSGNIDPIKRWYPGLVSLPDLPILTGTAATLEIEGLSDDLGV